jgi:MFS family permease
LTDAHFATFWGGAFISSIGFWVQSIGEGWQVLRLTNSPFLLGLVAFASTVPNLVLSPIGGVIADRFKRRHILICTQATYMLLTLFLSIVSFLHLITVWHIITVAFLIGLVSTVSFPAWQAFTSDITPPSMLRQGIALQSMQFNLSRVIGPAIGGILVGAVGVAGSYFLNSLSYLAIIIPLLLIRPRSEQNIQRPKGQSLFQSLGEGLQYVRSRPSLMALLGVQFVVAFLVYPFSTLLPVFADSIFHSGANGLGLLNSATGIGALLGSITLVSLTSRMRNGLRVLIIVSSIGGVTSLVFALSQNLSLSLALLVLLGTCTVISSTMTNTTIQTMVPQEMRARVLSLWILITSGLAPFGNLCAGWMAQLFGAPLTLSVAGVACVFLSLLFLLVRARPVIE